MPRMALIGLAVLTDSNIAQAEQASDPRIADHAQPGKRPGALFLPQYIKEFQVSPRRRATIE
jgi:hypothetical protein